MIRFKVAPHYKNLSLFRKRFLKKIKLEKSVALLSSRHGIEKKIPRSSTWRNDFEAKTALYRLLKQIQVFKDVEYNLNSSQIFGFSLQESFLTASNVERKKKRKAYDVKKKQSNREKKRQASISTVLRQKEILQSKDVFGEKVYRGCFFYKKLRLKSPALVKLFKSNIPRKKILERRLLIHRFKIRRLLLRGFKVRQILLYTPKKRLVKIPQKSQFKFRETLISQIMLRGANLQKKKKYKKVARFLRRTKESLQVLIRLYSRNFTRYNRKKQWKRKMTKRLIWKRGRKKKWKRRGLFRFFRSGLCFRNKFGISKCFEVNYKTGNVLYLGFADSNSLNFRLPFSLNLRRLVTVLSS